MKRLFGTVFGCVVVAGVAACSGGPAAPAPDTTVSPLVTTTTVTTAAAPATASATPTATEAPAPATSVTPPGTSPQTSPTGNNLGAEYCAKNQDPGCPAGSFVGPDAIPNPNGDGTWVACEGTICTNPNHGAGTPEPSAAPAEVPVEGAPCEGSGHWVHLTGGDAAHYGTEWLCARPGG